MFGMSTVDFVTVCLYGFGFLVVSIARGKYMRNYRKEKFVTKENPTPLEIIFLILTSIGVFVMPLTYIFTDYLINFNYHFPDLIEYGLTTLGIIIFYPAIYILYLSHKELTINFAPTLKIHEKGTLVTTGIYAYIRHPMYLAHLLWAISLPLLIRNYMAGFFMVIFFVPFVIVRIKKEEEFLIKVYGDKYREYMKRTGRIWF